MKKLYIYDKFCEIVKNFFLKNLENLSFESEREKREIEEFFFVQLPEPIKPKDTSQLTADEITEIASIKKIVKDYLEMYSHSGNKFFIFSNDPQRNHAIIDIQTKLNPILGKSKLDDADKLFILTTLVKSKSEAEDSHRSASTMGSWGVTQSRLANQLDDCIKALMNNGLIKNDNNPSFEKKM